MASEIAPASPTVESKTVQQEVPVSEKKETPIAESPTLPDKMQKPVAAAPVSEKSAAGIHQPHSETSDSENGDEKETYPDLIPTIFIMLVIYMSAFLVALVS